MTDLPSVELTLSHILISVEPPVFGNGPRLALPTELALGEINNSPRKNLFLEYPHSFS
jgi:hypothetical protein